jgi:hypothetical protein
LEPPSLALTSIEEVGGIRYLVSHDDDGNILAVSSHPDAAERLEIEGQTLIEVEGPPLEDGEPESLVRIMREFRVDRGRRRLEERPTRQ